MIQNTENIFRILTKDHFPIDVWNIYDLIIKFKDRIKFVKDSEGISNILVLSTKEAVDKVYSTDIPHFSLFLAMNSKNKIIQTQQLKIKDIYATVEAYLSKTTNPLYVQIFFEGSILEQHQIVQLHYILEEENCSINDAYSKIQVIPDFYNENASSAKEVLLEFAVQHNLRINELNHVKQMYQEKLDELNLKLPELTEIEYNQFIENLKSLKSQITELEDLVANIDKI